MGCNLSSWGITDTDLSTHLTATGQANLPQVPLLKSILNGFIQHGAIEEAYLRGSFSCGEADTLSDTDLFVVVTPENLPRAHTVFTQTLQSSADILIGCHDKFVADYGGIGFMFLTKEHPQNSNHSGHISQFDIYYALKGVPRTTNLFDIYRIYSRDPSYAWADDDIKNTSHNLPDTAVRFIQRETASSLVHKAPTPEDRRNSVISCFNDLTVGLFIMDKHLRRADRARAHNDDFQIINSLIRIVRAHEGKINHSSDLYSFKKLAQDISKRHNAQRLQRQMARISELMEVLPSTEKISACFKLGIEMMEDFAPDHLRTNHRQLVTLDHDVFRSGAPAPTGRLPARVIDLRP